MKKILAAALGAVLALTSPAAANIWAWSTTPSVNGNADIGSGINEQEGEAPSQLNDSTRSLMSVVKGWLQDTSGAFLATGGSGNAQTLTTSGLSSSSLVNGWTVCAKVSFTNSGAATLQVDSTSATAIHSNYGIALTGGELAVGQIQCFSYNATDTAWIMVGYRALNGGGSITYDANGALQRAALTGDVTASVGSNATTIANGAVTPAKTSTAIANFLVPVGLTFDWPTTSCPAHSLAADGSSRSTTTYSALFGVISYNFGGGGANFNLPDLRGYVVAGYDSGDATGRLTASASGGVDASTIGNTGGEQAHTMTTNELVSHNHTQQGTFNTGTESAGHTHGSGGLSWSASNNFTAVVFNGSSGYVLQAGGVNVLINQSTNTYTPTGNISGSTGGESNTHTHQVTISGATTSTGSTSAFNQVQPTFIMRKCIWTGV